MAAFSRGLSLGLGSGLSLRIFSFAPKPTSSTLPDRPMARVAHAIRRSPIIQAARNLQTSAPLHASKQGAKSKATPRATAPSKPPSRPEPTLSPVKRTPSPSVDATSFARGPAASVAATLAARRSPTILYQSPSHFWLRFSSLSAATFLISYAGINYYSTIVYPPPGLAWWVTLAFSMVCLVSAGFGYLFLFASARIVRRITAVPTTSLPPAYLKESKKMTAVEKQAQNALRASPIALECEVGGTFPLLGRRKLIAAPHEVLLPFKFFQAPVSRRAAQLPAAKTSQPGLAGTMAKPFQAVGRGAGGAFYGLRRGLTSEGFAPIMINGKRWKIDVLSGQVFGDGKMLDVLMPYRPDRFTNTWLDRLLKR